MSAARKIWVEKLEQLQKALALASEASEKFKLNHEIREAEEQIACLDAVAARQPSAEPTVAETPRVTSGVTVAQPLKAYALVIGVSKYKLPDESRDGKGPEPFPDLDFAAKDAKDFHNLLRERGYGGPEPLLDERASLRGIMHALDDLRRQCGGSKDAVVVIFFAGHGARDEADRHYLVPHDGVRDDLFATALWSRTFDNALEQLSPERLVVFLDACHAGGMEATGVRGKWPPCDPQKLAGDDGKSRYVVASCLAEQVSRERDGHGIFSRELLHLLRCEKEEDFEAEEIELYRLYNALKKRVLDETNNKQEPWANVKQPTGIVLAINGARRRFRIEREKSLLVEIDSELERREALSGPEVRDLIWTELQNFIERGVRLPARSKRFYNYFRARANELANARRGRDISHGEIEYTCDSLINLFHGSDAISGTPAKGPVRTTAAPPAPPREDAVAAAVGSGVVAPAAAPPAPAREDAVAAVVSAGVAAPPRPARVQTPPQPPSQRQNPAAQDKLCLTSTDVSDLLNHINARAGDAYPGRVSQLEAVLTAADGIARARFKAHLKESTQGTNAAFVNAMDELWHLFEQCWANAYKPGPWAFSTGDLKDVQALASKLTNAEPRPIDRYLLSRLPARWRDALLNSDAAAPDTHELQTMFLPSLNTVVHGHSIGDECSFEDIELRPETEQLQARRPAGEDLHKLNRLLLEDAYPQELARSRKLDAISVRRGVI